MLDPVTPANATVLWRIMQSAHLREFQDIPRFSREDFEKRVKARPLRLDGRTAGRFEWLICVAATRAAIGWISLRIGDRPAGSGELGYSLLLEYRGKGYASEAVAGLLDRLFETTPLRRLEACCVPANASSRRLLERIGFSQQRMQPNGAMVRGRPVDIVCFEVERNAWLNDQRASRAVAGGGRAGD